MKKVITILMTLLSVNSWGQNNKDRSIQKIAEVRKVYDNPEALVADYYFKKIIADLQKNISGTAIKDGKIVGSNVTTDDKGLNLSLYLHFLNPTKFFTQLTGSAASEDGIVNVFSNGKFNRIYSAGASFNYFPEINNGNFYINEKAKLHTQLRIGDKCFKEDAEKAIISNIITDVTTYIDNCCEKLNTIDKDVASFCDQCNLEKAKKYDENLKILKDNCCVDLEDLSCQDLKTAINNNKDCIINQYVNSKRLKLFDDIQSTAKWTVVKLKWFSGSIKLNQKSYNVFDTLSVNDFYKKSYEDIYASTTVSFNYMRQNKIKNTNTLISPTISFQNNRNFNEDDLITFQKNTRLLPPYNDTLTLVVNENKIYPKVADRTANLKFELPLQIYYTKSKGGLDLMIGTQVLFPTNEIDYSLIKNVYGKFGVFFPISTGEGKVITIEPLIRLQKLNKSGLVFFKDQFSFGFNLSFSLPSYLTN